MSNFYASISRPISFHEADELCQTNFSNGGPYWHLSTNGNGQEIIFRDKNDFCAAMNAFAIVAAEVNINIIAFVFMNNHVHMVIEGTKDDILLFFKRFKKRLSKYFTSKGRYDCLKKFDCGEPLRIENLKQLRIAIAYIHRNPYVAKIGALPYSYPWSSGPYYFNHLLSNGSIGVMFNNLSYKAKQEIFQGRVLSLPESYNFYDGFILPSSYIDIPRAEDFYVTPTDYYLKISKPQKDYCVLARLEGDTIVLNYEEAYSVAVALCKNLTGDANLRTLTTVQKLEIAKTLRYDYLLTNKHISSILKLDISTIEQLLPGK